LLDDTWSTGVRNSQALPTRSAWFASSASSLLAAAGSMTGSLTTSSRLWLTYFTASATSPVHLTTGQTLKVSLTFTPGNVSTAPTNTITLRLGLFDYADGGTRVAADTFSSSDGKGANVLGYGLFMNFTATFTDDTPLHVEKRTTLTDTNLIGRTGDYTTIPTNGPIGQLGKPGFVSGTKYTLVFLLSQNAASTDISAAVSGGSLNISNMVTDTSGLITNFDAFAIRADNATESAGSFQFTEMKVELLTNNTVVLGPPFKITAVKKPTTDTAVITWDSTASQKYQIQSRDTVNQSGWITNGSVTASTASTSFTNSGVTAVTQRYYRVVNTP
jgi:hypothetical protein